MLDAHWNHASYHNPCSDCATTGMGRDVPGCPFRPFWSLNCSCDPPPPCLNTRNLHDIADDLDTIILTESTNSANRHKVETKPGMNHESEIFIFPPTFLKIQITCNSEYYVTISITPISCLLFLYALQRSRIPWPMKRNWSQQSPSRGLIVNRMRTDSRIQCCVASVTSNTTVAKKRQTCIVSGTFKDVIDLIFETTSNILFASTRKK